MDSETLLEYAAGKQLQKVSNEAACKALWEGVKAVDALEISDPREREIVKILLGYIGKEVQLIMRTLKVE